MTERRLPLPASADRVRAFSAWLSSFDAASDPVAETLLAMPQSDLIDLVEANGRVFNVQAIDRMVTVAHRQLSKNPRRAELIARLATRLCEAVPMETINSEPLIMLDARASRMLAAANLKLGYYEEGLKAVARAKVNLDIAPVPGIEAVLLALIDGQLLHYAGRSDEGLLVLEEAAVALLGRYANEKKTYLEARTIYASILLDRQEYREALAIYDEAASQADKLGDSVTLAYIVQNVGYCCLQLGDTDRSEKCFIAALQMFEELGLEAEVQRARGGLVKILAARGRYNEAISELYKIRAIFLSMGVPVTAAMVALDIVELLSMARRTADVPHLCQEMFTTFMQAKLQKNALMALAYLAGLAKNDVVDTAHVAYVRNFFEELQRDPEKAFQAPVN